MHWNMLTQFLMLKNTYRYIYFYIQSHIIQTGWLEIWFLMVHVIKEDILISIKKRKEKSVKILPGWQI